MDHDHLWGPLEHARFTGNPHRKCTIDGCQDIHMSMGEADMFTFASKEAVEATIARLPQHYEMKLNRSDAANLIRSLVFVWENHTGELGDWTGQFASDIASTLEVEWI
jgi:hypothetical protein